MNGIEKINAWSGRLFSDGWVNAIGGKSPVRDPSTGLTIDHVGLGNKEDIHYAAFANVALLRRKHTGSCMRRTSNCSQRQP